MFNPSTYHKMAINMVQRIIMLGKDIHNDDGKVIGYTDRKGQVSIFAAYKGRGNADKSDNRLFEAIYTGDSAEKAATKYVETVGSFVAFGEAVKFFRKKNAALM